MMKKFRKASFVKPTLVFHQPLFVAHRIFGISPLVSMSKVSIRLVTRAARISDVRKVKLSSAIGKHRNVYQQKKRLNEM